MTDHHKLARLQLSGMLGLVLMVVLLLASYFFYHQWRDYRDDSTVVAAEARLRGQTFLKAYGDHAGNSLETLYSQTQDILRQRLREQVDQAYALADSLYRRHHGRLGDAALQREIVESLRPLRYFGARGYYFIDSLDGDCVLLPTSPQREGRSLLDNQDDQGAYVMRKLLLSVDNRAGSGFASYRWYRPGEAFMSEKIAYSRRFEPFGWLIGGGEYVLNVEEDLQRQALQTLAQMPVGERGFFAVIDSHGRLRQIPGQRGFVLPAALQRQLAATPQGYFVDFEHAAARYSAYVAVVPSWQWRVVSIVPEQELALSGAAKAQALGEKTRNRVLTTLLILTLALCLAWLFSVHFSRWLGALIAQYQQRLQASQRQVEDKAREIELTRHMSDSAADAIVLLSAQGCVVYHNEAARRCFGAGNTSRMAELFEEHYSGGQAHYVRRLPGDGGEVTLEVSLSGLCYQGEHYRCATARDVSARVSHERQQRLAATVFEASSEAILITDADSRIIAVNRAFSDITGYSEAEALGNTPALLGSGRHDAAFYADMWNHLRARGYWSGEIWNRRKNGEIYPEWLTINQVRNGDGSVSHYVALFSDISERKATEARVQHLAEYDFLTDLPNRLLLHDRLQQSLHLAERKQHKVAVLFMDLDRFKNVNDTLGHDAGDELLRQVAGRTQHMLREMDTVGRTGGDEFVIILPELADSAQAGLVAERVLQVLEAPFTIRGHTLVISASIGIAVAPADGGSPALLLKNADMAMYQAKASGRNAFRFFDPGMTAEVSERLLLENQLRLAMAQQRFYLELQPKYDIASRRLNGFEALLRWRQPDGRLVSPARFIPVAEDSGVITELGLWVLEQACRTATEWVRHGRQLTIAVNVSARQLTHGDFCAEVARVLRDSGLPPALLELEVTEGTLIDYSGPVRQQLAGIKALGVRLAVDDFGTGYSSLAYLKNFAPDTVKIDRSFVSGLQHNRDNAAIVSAIITLARNLDMESLAEGVETEAELAALQALGCDTVQGYLTGRPLAVNDALALCRLQAPADAA
ncbi:EAL domain-containing protein [Vogesella sp. LYT5W]|uniref:EAL domain-containing protein n=1 Tax=Vogesella margarita TaxID=2984199 RepID=A0ABT5ISQ0_9NEIS|nr:EAL domain-containing protein [Vogesella margarita]MDC7715325.1 EAL domain-containing protein [Vogesella margarita]